MSELVNLLWTEKYRAVIFIDLIFENKDTILNYLKIPKLLPSFIFWSTSPGTGKTTLAKLIAQTLGADILSLNSSKDRGIETIRQDISLFVESVSSNQNTKRIVFMDEADFITPTAQASLRNIMEEFSENVFFIFTANDISKIINPIQSRCVIFNFDKPNKKEILNRLIYICEKEEIEHDVEDLSRLVNLYYPDIRSMVKTLQSIKIDGKPLKMETTEYMDFINALIRNDIQEIYRKVYSTDFNILACNRWLFKYFIDNPDSSINLSRIAFLLADTEKAYTIGANLPLVFIANCLQIEELLPPIEK
jgi:replication factor C small subunit